MPKQKESKHAAKLRDLGFKRYDELLSAEDMKETDQIFERAFGAPPTKLSRALRRKLEASKVLPGFGFLEGKTYAMDETGVDWSADGEIDLTPFGFYNKPQFFAAIGTKKGSRLN